MEIGRCPQCGRFNLICVGVKHKCRCMYEEPCGIHFTRDWWLPLKEHREAVNKGIRQPVYREGVR